MANKDKAQAAPKANGPKRQASAPPGAAPNPPDPITPGPMTKGNAGETHQHATGPSPTMTTKQGVPISDNQNTLRYGPRGPALMEDFHFREKIFQFDHERIPERVVHARGYGAHGFFELTKSLEKYSHANILTQVGVKTPVFVRFSTVAGAKGSVDLPRDVRGFATKFYTNQGNWDLVGNNIPVFFIQDPIKFPDVIHSVKEEPDRAFPQAASAHDNFWDFITLTPESMHMIMWAMSDRAIPRSFRFMQGFGVHSFRLVNQAGESCFVKFHWKPKLGLQSVLWNEAVKINGADSDFHRRDLWDAITMGDFPEWELGVQIFDDAFADSFPFDILDPTKIIPEEDLPVEPIGRLVLDRVVDNFFLETEQVAFCTQNIVPGIDFSNDPLLQGRNFSYLDTQLKRLGSPNFTQIPINAPKCPMHNFHQDGHMAMRNPVGRVNYEPNSWGNMAGPRQDPNNGFKSVPVKEDGPKIRQRSDTFADHYSQARQFFISQTPIEQKHIGDALVFELSKVERIEIRIRMLAHLRLIDEILAVRVATGLGMKLPDPAEPARPVDTSLQPSKALSILENGPKTLAGRRIGILLTDGADAALYNEMVTSIAAEKATYQVVAPKIIGAVLSDGTLVPAHQKIDGGPSVLYDAVVIITSDEGAKLLAGDSCAKDFVCDAFAHCKYIGYAPEALPLLSKAGIAGDLDQACISLKGKDAGPKFLLAARALRFWERELKVDLDALP